MRGGPCMAQVWAEAAHPTSAVGSCNVAGAGREGNGLAMGVSPCGCPFLPACQDLCGGDTKWELGLDDVPQCSAAISLFISGSAVLWFWRTSSSVIAIQRWGWIANPCGEKTWCPDWSRKHVCGIPPCQGFSLLKIVNLKLFCCFFYCKFYVLWKQSQGTVFKDPDYMDVESLMLHNPVLFYRLVPCSDYTS